MRGHRLAKREPCIMPEVLWTLKDDLVEASRPRIAVESQVHSDRLRMGWIKCDLSILHRLLHECRSSSISTSSTTITTSWSFFFFFWRGALGEYLSSWGHCDELHALGGVLAGAHAHALAQILVEAHCEPRAEAAAADCCC